MLIGYGIRTWGIFLIAAIASAWVSNPALAADQVMAFKGTLTSYATGPGLLELSDVPVGSTVRGQVLYDDTTTDADGSATVGSYSVTTFTLGFDGTVDLHIGISPAANIVIRNDDPSGPDFRDEVRITTGSLTVPSLGMTVADLQFRINEVSNPAPTVLASDALPSPVCPQNRSGVANGFVHEPYAASFHTYR